MRSDFYSGLSRVRTAVGWEPRTSLEDGFRRTDHYYPAHKGHR